MERITEKIMKIEHVYSRKFHHELQLDYSNFVAYCQGNNGKSYEEQHCDTSKQDRNLPINPAKIGNILHKIISYSKDGIIKSSNAEIDAAINNILHLNIDKLRNNRKYVYKSVLYELSKLPTYANKNQIKKIIDRWENKDTYGKFYPYYGVAVFILEK